MATISAETPPPSDAEPRRPALKRHNPFRDFFLESSFVARVYGESLRDNFVGYQPIPGKEEDAGRLEKEYLQEINKPEPDFASLLRIEAAFTGLLPDESIRSRYWAVDDRFQRVVPTGTRANYQASVPTRGNAKWQDPAFLRTQTRTLLDIIYANYILNIGREKSVKRLKIIMLIVFVASTSLTLFVTHLSSLNEIHPMGAGVMLIAYFGMLGSILSISQRLQQAVARDAMAEDGIFELTGLRIGWVGILMSIFMGGAFAVILYFIVISGVLKVAYPSGLDEAAPPAEATASSAAPPDPASADPIPGSASAPEAAPPILSRAGTPDVAEKAAVAASPPQDRFARIMQFHTLKDWYKMLVLAFLAGFAERLVPDILNRLSKRGT